MTLRYERAVYDTDVFSFFCVALLPKCLVDLDMVMDALNPATGSQRQVGACL